MKFDFLCQGHMIILIMRMSRLHIQILGTKQSDESVVIRLPSRLVEFPVYKSAIQLFTNQLVLHLCRRKGTPAVDEFS